MLTVNHPGELTGKEQKKFQRAVRRIHKHKGKEANLQLLRYLNSNHSHEFKTLLTCEFSSLRVAQLWGSRFFTPELLSQLIHEQLPSSKPFTISQATSILENPAAITTSSYEDQTRTPLSGLFAEPEVPLERKEMVYKLALRTKDTNIYQMRQIFNGITHEPELDPEPILEWTATRYELDGYPPEIVKDFLLHAHPSD